MREEEEQEEEAVEGVAEGEEAAAAADQSVAVEEEGEGKLRGGRPRQEERARKQERRGRSSFPERAVLFPAPHPSSDASILSRRSSTRRAYEEIVQPVDALFFEVVVASLPSRLRQPSLLLVARLVPQ